MTDADARIEKLEALLREARDHVTAKPWDDRSCLHARISVALGLEVEYKDHMMATGQWDDVKRLRNPDA